MCLGNSLYVIDRAGAVCGRMHVYYLCLPRLISTGIFIGQRPPEHVAALCLGRGLTALCACLLEQCCETQLEVGDEVIKNSRYCVKLQKLTVMYC